jgi:small nuclear ribonucleoprotein
MDKTFIYDRFRICIYRLLEHGVIMEPSKKPLNVLVKQLHGNIEVFLKNGCEYKGKMIKCDGHMNILLEGATECKQDQLLTNYGNVLLRGNNVLYIILDPTKH